MEGPIFDEIEFFGAISKCEARALLIGRRALIALGLPVLTADYDFWVHPDDTGLFNGALEVLNLFPNRSPEEARRYGRYVLQNDETVDVLCARRVSTIDHTEVSFDDLWARRVLLTLSKGATVALPTIEDLILTKRFASRPKDAEDIRLLEELRKEKESPQ